MYFDGLKFLSWTAFQPNQSCMNAPAEIYFDFLTGSHAMRRIYLKTIGGRPRPDWCLLSNRVGGHDINRSNRINKTNINKWQQTNKQKEPVTNRQKANNNRRMHRKWASQDYQTRDLKRPLCLRNRDRAVKMTAVGLKDNSEWPNRRIRIKVLLVIVKYCGWL